MFAVMRTWSAYPKRIYEPHLHKGLVYASVRKTDSLCAYGLHVFLIELEGSIGGTFNIDKLRTDLVPPGAIALDEGLGWISFHSDSIVRAWHLGEHPGVLTLDQAKAMVKV